MFLQEHRGVDAGINSDSYHVTKEGAQHGLKPDLLLVSPILVLLSDNSCQSVHQSLTLDIFSQRSKKRTGRQDKIQDGSKKAYRNIMGNNHIYPRMIVHAC